MLRRKVPAHRVLGHSDVSPARKKDPGEKFPWHSLANSGVGHWVQPAPIVRGDPLKLGTTGDDVHDLQQALARYGYGIPINGKFDAEWMVCSYLAAIVLASGERLASSACSVVRVE